MRLLVGVDHRANFPYLTADEQRGPRERGGLFSQSFATEGVAFRVLPSFASQHVRAADGQHDFWEMPSFGELGVLGALKTRGARPHWCCICVHWEGVLYCCTRRDLLRCRVGGSGQAVRLMGWVCVCYDGVLSIGPVCLLERRSHISGS